MKPSANCHKGFSLIEMMVVVGISAILTVMVGVQMGGFTNRLTVQEQSIRFRDVLWHARNLALVSGQCVTVSIVGQDVTVISYALTPNCVAPFGAPTSTTITTFPSDFVLQP